MSFYIDPRLAKHFSDYSRRFDQIMATRGEVFRELEGRRTQRVIWNGNGYFIKQHFGIGWREIFKNLLQLRLPVISAKNEWLAIQRLQIAGVPTMQIMGYGARGINPAHIQSFLITQELTHIKSLEDLCRDWPTTPPPAAMKYALIKEVARITRIMHDNGINHRDCYICHFLLDTTAPSLRLYLIDLHRAQIRRHVPLRWRIKDLAGLYFSSKDSGLTTRDLLRFMREYRQTSLRDILINESSFWQKVKQRGNKTYREHGK